MTTLTEILMAAKSLTAEDRRAVIHELVETFPIDDPEFGLSPAWQEEIAKRAKELDKNPALGVPWEDVRQSALKWIDQHASK